MALAVFRHQAADEGEGAVSLRHAVEEGTFRIHLQRGLRVAGEEGIAAQLL